MRSVVTRLQRVIKFETVEMLLQQRTAASTAYSSVTKARALQCLPSAFTAVQAQRVSSVWRDATPARQLHISSIPRAAATDADLAEEGEEKGVYECGDDAFDYLCYACITGTVKTVNYQEGQPPGLEKVEPGPWMYFTLNVPTPHDNGVTEFHVLANGVAAKQGRAHVQEGACIQVTGTFLPPPSLQSTRFGYVGNIPAVYATMIGYWGPDSNPEDLALKLQHVVVPTVSEPDVDAFVNSLKSVGQHRPFMRWPGAEGLPAATPGAAAAPPAAAGEPIFAEGMPQQASNETEAAWVSLFQENHLWVDQRETKRGKQPDFRLRARVTDGSGRPDALWIQDRKTPSWVKRNLQLLPGGKPYQLKPFIPAEALTGTPTEQQWVQVFENYGQFWDNRASKTNPRAPDFSPKDREAGGKALWITSRDTPDWVQDNLHELPAPPPPR